MRAHFALEPIQEADSYEKRVDDFKNDPEKMEVVTDFVMDVLRIAEIQVQCKLKSEQEVSGRFGGQFPALTNFKNGRIVNGARNVMVRLFDVICNCANAAAAPAQQLSTKRLSKH